MVMMMMMIMMMMMLMIMMMIPIFDNAFKSSVLNTKAVDNPSFGLKTCTFCNDNDDDNIIY